MNDECAPWCGILRHYPTPKDPCRCLEHSWQDLSDPLDKDRKGPCEYCGAPYCDHRMKPKAKDGNLVCGGCEAVLSSKSGGTLAMGGA